MPASLAAELRQGPGRTDGHSHDGPYYPDNGSHKTYESDNAETRITLGFSGSGAYDL